MNLNNTNALIFLTEKLLHFFEMETGDWPMLTVYNDGNFKRGVIPDELYAILTEMQSILERDDEGDDGL